MCGILLFARIVLTVLLFFLVFNSPVHNTAAGHNDSQILMASRQELAGLVQKYRASGGVLFGFVFRGRVGNPVGSRRENPEQIDKHQEDL